MLKRLVLLEFPYQRQDQSQVQWKYPFQVLSQVYSKTETNPLNDLDLRGLITFLLVNLGSNQDVAEEALEPDAPLQLYTLRFLAILWCKTHFLLTSQLKYLNISKLSQLIFFFLKTSEIFEYEFYFQTISILHYWLQRLHFSGSWSAFCTAQLLQGMGDPHHN